MTVIEPDMSFERDGRGLGEWLMPLVSEDVSEREEAGEALGGMWTGWPWYTVDWERVDLENVPEAEPQMKRFEAAVRAAVEEPGFPKEEFVKRLCRHRIWLRNRELAAVEAEDAEHKRHEPYEDRLMRQLLETSNEDEGKQIAARLYRFEAALFQREDKLIEANQEPEAPSMMAWIVFRALDRALLVAPAELEAVLQHPYLCLDAAAALERIGPPAIKFADHLIEQMDAATGEPAQSWMAAALGSIARDNGRLVEALLERLRSGSKDVQEVAAETLERLGPHMAGREDEAVTLLTQALDRTVWPRPMLGALASVGRRRADVLERVLSVAVPGEPQMFDTGYGLVDRRMTIRGSAIDALGYFVAFPDRVLPVLIDAIDTFEEFDPDYQYDGDHARVCWTLQRFGSAASPAVPRMVAYLQWWRAAGRGGEGPEWPRAMLQALEAIGPAAKDALPLLEEWVACEREDDGLVDDQLAKALAAVRGE